MVINITSGVIGKLLSNGLPFSMLEKRGDRNFGRSAIKSLGNRKLDEEILMEDLNRIMIRSRIH